MHRVFRLTTRLQAQSFYDKYFVISLLDVSKIFINILQQLDIKRWKRSIGNEQVDPTREMYIYSSEGTLYHSRLRMIPSLLLLIITQSGNY